MTIPLRPSQYTAPLCPGSVRRHEDLPDDAVEGSMCMVLEGAPYSYCIFLRTGGRWVQMASQTPPVVAPVADDRIRRRAVVCATCGAPVSPKAERCEHCGAWMEQSSGRTAADLDTDAMVLGYEPTAPPPKRDPGPGREVSQ